VGDVAHQFVVGANLPTKPFRRSINEPLGRLAVADDGLEVWAPRPLGIGFPKTRWSLTEIRRLAPIRGRFRKGGFQLEDSSGDCTFFWCSREATRDVLGICSRLGLRVEDAEVYIGWWRELLH
jgi:hypothetical protein